MKKLTLLALSLLLIFTIFGCQNKENTEVEKSIETPALDFEYKNNDDGTITIEKYYGCSENVVIPEKIDGKKVTVIGSYSFSNNSILKSVVIPNSVTELEFYAFKDVVSLKKVKFSDNLEVIGPAAFDSCISLSDITLPDGLKSIGGEAFRNCKSLKSIEIPQSVNLIEHFVFYESGLETVKLNNGQKDIVLSLLITTTIKEIIFSNSVDKVYLADFAIYPELTSIKFEGNAPDVDIPTDEIHTKEGVTVYYHKGAKGFTSSEWNGYQTQVW